MRMEPASAHMQTPNLNQPFFDMVSPIVFKSIVMFTTSIGVNETPVKISLSAIRSKSRMLHINYRFSTRQKCPFALSASRATLCPN